ncbi:hypothetical protein HYS00_01395 [Candidatus Microgenomates bacterium]|nr:hypothetical protein [Candidatus Microgenomates bacterium]
MNHFFTQIRKEVKRTPLDYLLLLTSGVFFLVFLQIFKGERRESMLVLAVFACFYIAWGIIHHVHDRTLHVKNMVEYIVIAASVLLLLLMMFI